jgi:hypothetical protein
MYKVYLKVFNERGLSEVVAKSRTTTPDPKAAEVAFRNLISRNDLIGKKAHAVLSLDNRQLMYHRFDHHPGMTDYVGPDDKIRLFHEN